MIEHHEPVARIFDVIDIDTLSEVQKMKALKVLRSGEVQGEYIFNVQLVRIYLHLKSAELQTQAKGST